MIPRKTLTTGIVALGLIAAIPAVASAAPRDSDHDGLSNRAERRLGTNPRKADTDSDGLKDGREVRLRTNPRRADSDRDGLSDGLEVGQGSNPRRADSDGDGLRDGREAKGTVAAVGADSVTITRRDGSQTTFAVTAQTRLRVPDRDASGTITLADVQVGDRVELHLATDGTTAIALKVERNHGRDDGANEVKGVISAIGADSVTITHRDGSQVTLSVNAQTRLRAPDRDASGTITIADLQVGDRVEAHVGLGGSVATRIDVKVAHGPGHPEGGSQDIEGTISAVGADSVTITLRDGSQTTVAVTAETELKAPDRDASGTVTLADFQVGDRVEAHVGVDGTTATKLEIED
ncbi:unannotated protein [freshwater metagenome]|uniref:Unannotated protein n=1 Tax=freshwater metagenome TaxID=449393 RepID=A0A6J7EHC1_9ZZZZ|nr:hypothetical protein [Actinomycetota bacterium]